MHRLKTLEYPAPGGMACQLADLIFDAFTRLLSGLTQLTLSQRIDQ
jgi:hypothetical protein